MAGWSAKLIALLVFLAPLVTLYAAQMLTWLVLLIVLTILGRDLRGDRSLSGLSRPVALLFGMLLLWAAASLFWTVSSSDSLGKLVELAIILPAILILTAGKRRFDEEERRRIGMALVFGLGLILTLLLVDRLLDLPLLRFLQGAPDLDPGALLPKLSRGGSLAVLLIWPLVLAPLLAASRFLTGLVLIAVMATMGMLYTLSVIPNASAMALGLGLAGFLAMLASGPGFSRWLARAIGLVAAVLCLAAPWAIPATADLVAPEERIHASQNVSINHRLIIWDYVSARSLERPFTGYGLNTSRALEGGRITVPLLPAAEAPRGELISLHPHNAPLQIWLELGLPGAVLAAMLMLLVAHGASRITDPMGRASATALMLSGFAIASLSYGVWQAWWLAALSLAVFLIHALRQDERPIEPNGVHPPR